MATITFDTLQYVEKLKSGGFSDVQAKVMAEAQKQAIDTAADSTLATKADIHAVRDDIKDIKAEVMLLRWMIGFSTAIGVAGLWLLIRMGAGVH
jgi:hypothetical protein